MAYTPSPGSPSKCGAALACRALWYSGTHQIWRDVYIGPEHALNPERLLREHFGIERLALVTGGSMGAQQTYRSSP